MLVFSINLRFFQSELGSLVLLMLSGAYLGSFLSRRASAAPSNSPTMGMDSLFEQLPDGIVLLRGEKIVLANSVAKRIFQNAGDELMRNRVAEAVAKVMPVPLDLKVDGHDFHYMLQAHPVRLPFAERMVIAQDMTIAREGQGARVRFLGTLSHEVKTPLTSITMAIRLLQRGIEQIPNTVHRSLITNCVADVERLRLLLDDLVAVSRTEPLAAALDPQRVDLSKLLRHTAQNFRAEATARGVTVVAQQAESLKGKFISVDATKMTWAISRLLGYALREAPAGAQVEMSLNPAASIAGEPADLEGDVSEWIALRIRSGAVASDMTNEDILFDKSISQPNILSEQPGNTGFGLAIAREILASHGGRLWLEGSDLVLTLPVRGVEAFTARSEIAQPGLVRKPEEGAAAAASTRI